MENENKTQQFQKDRRVIYDFGSNNGDDIPYYLKKGDLVVAVEANPSLCDQIRSRFKIEISAGKLFVENCVLTTSNTETEVPFYIHRSKHVLSQFLKPINRQNFEEVILPAKSAVDIVNKYGIPYYIKIDVEHYDEQILRSLFENNIRPPFISAESHTIEIFTLLVSLGGYQSFNLVDGQSVSTQYKEHRIKVIDGDEIYSFPSHSAGPFGEDIQSNWMTANNFLRFLAYEKLGWKDIHATTQIIPDKANASSFEFYSKKDTCERKVRKVPPFIPKFIRKFLR